MQNNQMLVGFTNTEQMSPWSIYSRRFANNLEILWDFNAISLSLEQKNSMFGHFKDCYFQLDELIW